MNLPQFSVNQRVLVNILMIAAIIVGLFVYFKIPREIFPDVSMDEVVIVTSFPGASPSEIEKLITDPIEDEVSDVDHKDFISSRSTEGLSIVDIRFESGTDLDEAVVDIQTEMAKVTDLPEDAEDPIIIEIRAHEVMPVVMVVLGGEDEVKIKQAADDLQELILDVKGVANVRPAGMREREIQVDVDPGRLEAYQLTLSDVNNALGARNLNIPAGRFQSGRSEYLIRTLGEFDEVDRIKEVVVKSEPNGGVVRVEDLAGVKETWADAVTISRLNGKPGITLVVTKKEEGDSINIVDEIKEIINKFKETSDISFAIHLDTSKEIKNRLTILKKNALLGIILILILLYLFIGFRNAVLTAIGIPFTFLCAFIFMHAAGISLNVIAIFSLVIALGMIVDDAIIVIENVYRRMEHGMPAPEAAIVGAREVGWPVVSAVLTTVAAFLPILLMTGMMGKFMSVIP
ncbi:MAG: efflux RND transporter permease subunit, partial [bacterium]|nr:efflux RND transporter permease subunit [bacterium]